MALCEVHWFSNVLQKHVGMNVLLPDTGTPPFATYYLLHGLTDDYTGWIRRSRIEVYARDMPLIIVMPDGFRGFYTDHPSGPAYGKYIAEELVEFIERNFPARRTRSARCIGGLSMGGYGAMRAAFAYPENYISANCHSGALLYGARNQIRNPSPLTPHEQREIFGPKPAGTSHDLFALAARAKRSGRLPKLLLDCGTEDHLLGDSRAVHEKLARLNIPHQYHEYPGDHDWNYWDAHIREALAFHAKALHLRG